MQNNFGNWRQVALVGTLLLLVGCTGDSAVSAASSGTDRHNKCDNSAACIQGRLEVIGGSNQPAPAPGAKLFIEGHEDVATSAAEDGTFALPLQITTSALTELADDDFAKRPFNLVAIHESDGKKFGRRLTSLVMAGQNILDLGRLELKETGAIEGRVLLGDGASALGVDVYVPGTSFVAKAAEDGRFVILYVPEGDYPLVYEKTGYFLKSAAGIRVLSKQVSQTESVTLNAKDNTPPSTTVVSGPSAVSNQQVATFLFSSSESSGSFLCRLDSGRFQPCMSTASFVRLGEGEHVLEVSAVDGSGNIDSMGATYRWRVDLSAPLLTVESQPSAVTRSQSAVFRFAVDDSTAAFHCILDSSEVVCGTRTDLSNLAQGYHLLQVYVEDAAGNRSPVKALMWQVDLVAVDTIAIQTPAPLSNSTSATVIFASNKAATFLCSFDGNAQQPCTSPITYTGLTSGSYLLRITSVDATGSADATPLLVAWQVDAAAPAAPALTVVADELTNDATPTLSWSASDSDTQYYELEVDITPSFNSTQLHRFGSVTGLEQTVVPQLSDGIWYYRARAIDSAGNTSAWSTALSFTLDTVAPESPVASYLPDPYNNARPQFSWSTVVGADHYRMQVATDGNFKFLSLDITDIESVTFRPPSDLSAGTTFWRVASVDAAGNQSQFSQPRMFTIDTSAPDAPVANTVASPTKNKRPSFSWSAVTGVSKYRIQISTSTLFSSMVVDDASLTATSYTPSSDLNDNLYYWRVASIDAAQNQSGYSEPKEFLVDTSAPPAPTLVAYPSPSNDLTPTLQWLNPGAGAVLYDLQVIQGATTVVNQTGLTQLEYTPTAPLSAVATTWKVRATDAAGNIGAWSGTGSFTLTSAATWRLKALGERKEFSIPGRVDGSFFEAANGVLYVTLGEASDNTNMVTLFGFQSNAWFIMSSVLGNDYAHYSCSPWLLRSNSELYRLDKHIIAAARLIKVGVGSGVQWGSSAYEAQLSNAASTRMTEIGGALFGCGNSTTGALQCGYHNGENFVLEETIAPATPGTRPMLLAIPPGKTEPDAFIYTSLTATYQWVRRNAGVWETLATCTSCGADIYASRFLADGRPAFAVNLSTDIVWNGSVFQTVAAVDPRGQMVSTGTVTQKNTALNYYDGSATKTFPVEVDNGEVLTAAWGGVANNKFSLPRGWLRNYSTNKLELVPFTKITSLDVSPNIGKYSSLAFKSDGSPRIAYYDNAANKLKLAEKVSGNWTTSVIDSGTNVGMFASLALKSTGKGVIAYFDDATGDLKVATEGVSSWITEAIDSAGDVGRYASLAVGTDDNPRIAYHDETNGDLKLASFNGTQWIIEVVDASSVNMGEAISLALDGSNHPRIAYYDATGKVLRYASHDGASWTLSTVDDAADVGSHVSLALKSTGLPMIAYYDATNGDLKFAEWDGSSWQIATKQSTGDVGKYVSLVADSKNEPHITFYDETGGNLKYGNRDTNWAFRVIDGDEATIDNRGLWTSLKLNPTNQSPSASYFDAVEGGVRFVEGMVLY
jgi:hypothetical protein